MSKPTQSQAVHRARELIHDQCTQPLTLDTLSAVSGLAKPAFLRAFKRITGLPPHAYQLHLRVELARRLIASGATVSDAAQSAGFYDQSHLHRHFVRIMGTTPRAYAKR